MRDSLPLRMWAAEDRPSNRIEDLGVGALSNAELLSIIIGSGTERYNQVEIAQRLLAEYDNSLKRIASLSVSQLSQFEGIGEATAKRILSALDLGRRMFVTGRDDRPDLGTATRIYNHMHPIIGGLEVEEFWALLMNQNYRLLKKVRISIGGITETIVDVRVLMKEAVLVNATTMAVCHNHPSGRLVPSSADEELTRNIKKACELMLIRFIDHVIIADGSYYSYHELGKI